MSDVEHNRSRYVMGCRCAVCTAANRDYARASMYQRRHAGRVPPEHGANGYWNYGCRCPMCRAGMRATLARLREKVPA